MFSIEITKRGLHSRSTLSPCLIYVHVFVPLEHRALQYMLVFNHWVYSSKLENKSFILVHFVTWMVKEQWLFCVTLRTLSQNGSCLVSLWLGCFLLAHTCCINTGADGVFIVARGAFCGCNSDPFVGEEGLAISASCSQQIPGQPYEQFIVPWRCWSWVSQSWKVLPETMYIPHLWPF